MPGVTQLQLWSLEEGIVVECVLIGSSRTGWRGLERYCDGEIHLGKLI